MRYTKIEPDREPVVGTPMRQMAMPEGGAYLIDQLHPGEPIMVIRASDAGAMVFLGLYGAAAGQGDLFDFEKRESLAVKAAEFREFRRAHPELVKDPD